MATYLKVNDEECIGCELCVQVCPATPCIFEMRDIQAVVVHTDACEECMLCIEACPTDAITMSASEDVFLDFGDL